MELQQDKVTSMDAIHIAALSSIVGDSSRILTAPPVVEQLSRDFYWYSPVLRKQLAGKVADLAVQPLTPEEVQGILRYCYAKEIPGPLAERAPEIMDRPFLCKQA